MSASSLVSEVRTMRQLPTPTLARAVREAAGVSQARLAQELGVGRVTITRWESGQRRPRGPLARRYGDLIARLRTEVGA